jgi:hypothetical protein
MASRNLLETGGFTLVTRDLAQTLAEGRLPASLPQLPGAKSLTADGYAPSQRSFSVVPDSGSRPAQGSPTAILADESLSVAFRKSSTEFGR